MDVDTSDDSSDEEIFRLALEDDGCDFMTGMYLYATHHDKYYIMAMPRKPIMSGLEWVDRKLADRNRCYTMFRMRPSLFHLLHDLLVQSYGLKSSTKSTSVKALGMSFLWMVGALQSITQAEDRFERSLSTAHNNFSKVLKS